MANLVEFLVKVKDLASGPLGKIATTGSSSFARLDSGLNRVTSNFNRLGMSINDIDKRLDNLRRTRSISVDSSQIRRVNQEIEQLERRKSRLEGGGSRGNSLMGLAGSGLAMAGIAGGLGVLGGIANAGMQREATQMRFGVMAGKQEGGKLTNSLTSFAEKSIYGNEVFGAAQTMMGFGIQAQKVMPYMRMIGDVAMGDAQRLSSLTLAFSQVQAAGKLTGQDLLQFVNAGFNPLQAIAEKTGKTLGQLKEEVSEGKVSFNDVAWAFQKATGAGGRFHNMTQTLSGSSFGKWAAFKGSIEGLAASLGLKVLPYLSKFITLGQFFVDHSHFIFGAAAAWGAYAGAVGIATLATKYQTWALSEMTVKQWLFNTAAAINPYAAAAAGLAVLYVWLDKVLEQYGGWGVAMEASWLTAKAWGLSVGTAFKDAFQTIGYWVEWGILQFKNFGQHVSGVFGNMEKAFGYLKAGQISKAKSALSAEVRTTAEGEIRVLNGVREGQRQKNLADIAAANQNANYAWDRMLWNKKSSKDGKGADEIAGAGGLGGLGEMSVPSSLQDSSKGITGGGAKNLTITIGKMVESIQVNSTTLTEGLDQIEEKVTEVFLRIVNSGQAIAD